MSLKVHLLIRGRIGERWYDVDRQLKLDEGTTLGGLIEHCERLRIPIAEALAESPHLEHTLMINGERCPLATCRDRPLADGDQLYLLSPLAGG